MKSNLENKKISVTKALVNLKILGLKRFITYYLKTRQKPLLLLLEIADLIKPNNRIKKIVCLALATGSSPNGL
jgi:hypothetical protein